MDGTTACLCGTERRLRGRRSDEIGIAGLSGEPIRQMVGTGRCGLLEGSAENISRKIPQSGFKKRIERLLPVIRMDLSASAPINLGACAFLIGSSWKSALLCWSFLHRLRWYGGFRISFT